MPDFAREVVPIRIEDEMRRSYLDYAMSVIVGRALPDVRDGLKPVHRRVLFAMHESNTVWNRPYVKCARVVGDVLGKYHPHGDTATYDALVRMAQTFSLRYMLIDGQGNFGSVDGDPPAAYRYTECRMSQIAGALLEDIDKETVDFVPNYDNKEQEPTVLPSRIPNLLVNGSSGIAVGMATNIPPHNLREVINGCLALIEDPDLTVDDLMEHIPAPDFPTAAIINGIRGIREGYRTGRGRVVLRARSHIEAEKGGTRESIVVTEIPYQVNKARMLQRIAELVKEKKVEGIAEMRDESDKDGMRVVFDLKRGEIADVVLNNLYQHSQLQSVFGINMVALVDGQPRTLNLKQFLEYFLRHRRDVVTRRTLFELRKARERAHVLEGQAVALANIDEVIALIRAAASPSEAKIGLMGRAWDPGAVNAMLERTGAKDTRPDDLAPGLGLGDDGYRLSEVQAQAILDLRLQKLTGLEQDKILGEFEEILLNIARLLNILSSADQLMKVIREELELIRDQYADPRRSEIVADHMDLTLEDLIAPEDVVVTLSHGGYVKAQPLNEYQAQRRGGKGKAAASTKDEDFIDKLFVANSHDTVLCFSSRGRVYWLKVYELPQAGRTARGRPMVNLLPLEEGERINAVLPVRAYEEGLFVFMATLKGVVKKTPLTEFSRPLSRGIIAMNLAEDDYLIGVNLTDGNQELMVFTSAGKAVRFREGEVRPTGRDTQGVRGVTLEPGQRVISLVVAGPGAVLTVTENGYGKRTPVEEFPTKGRGGKGVLSISCSERNGEQVGAVLVNPDDEIMLITVGGTLVRTAVSGISVLGRNTQGVKLISLAEGERLSSIERIVGLDEGADAPEPPAAASPDSDPGPDSEPGEAPESDPDSPSDFE